MSWNVNSIRSRVDGLTRWLENHDPDVVLLQETRGADSVFPFEVFAQLGYEVAHHGRDHRNGVAIASRLGLADVHRGFEDHGPPPFDEPRLISATVGDLRIHSVYVPNGRTLTDPHYEFKLDWLARLRRQVMSDLSGGIPTIIGGDFNVAPADLDIYDPKRWRGQTHASPPERAALSALLDEGLHDVMRDHESAAGLYTWWNYRPGQFSANRGLRIDLFLLSAGLAERVTRTWVDLDARGDTRPSDHAPIVVELARSPSTWPDSALIRPGGA